jgi:hypothetical protein
MAGPGGMVKKYRYRTLTGVMKSNPSRVMVYDIKQTTPTVLQDEDW